MYGIKLNPARITVICCTQNLLLKFGGMLVKVAELSGYRWKWFLWHRVKLLLCINRSVLGWKFIAEKLFTTFVGHKRWAPEVGSSLIARARRKFNLNNKRRKTIFQSPSSVDDKEMHFNFLIKISNYHNRIESMKHERHTPLIILVQYVRGGCHDCCALNIRSELVYRFLPSPSARVLLLFSVYT